MSAEAVKPVAKTVERGKEDVELVGRVVSDLFERREDVDRTERRRVEENMTVVSKPDKERARARVSDGRKRRKRLRAASQIQGGIASSIARRCFPPRLIEIAAKREDLRANEQTGAETRHRRS